MRLFKYKEIEQTIKEIKDIKPRINRNFNTGEYIVNAKFVNEFEEYINETETMIKNLLEKEKNFKKLIKTTKEQQRKIDEITKIINETEMKTWDGNYYPVKDLQFVKWIEDIINENNI